MKIRYQLNSKHKLSSKTKIYSAEELNFPIESIDNDAINAITRLQSMGYEAYLVGGAVRDLLCGLTPKDFDLVTSATPKQIRNLFKNARIIGQRFKIVHLFYGRHKTLEITTFRALSSYKKSQQTANIFGTIEEDVMRRDFTLNALYYDPSSREIIDYVDGYNDIINHRLRCIVPLKYTFKEDPIRIMRAVKYCTGSHCQMPSPLIRKIQKQAFLLNTVSSSRLCIEIDKIFAAPYPLEIITMLIELKIFPQLFPYLAGKKKTKLRQDVLSSLKCKSTDPFTLFLLPLISIQLNNVILEKADSDFFYTIIKQLKIYLMPYIPPNHKIEDAVKYYYNMRNITPPSISYKNWMRIQKKNKLSI